MAEENQKPVEAKPESEAKPQQHQQHASQKPAFQKKQKQKEKEPAISLDGVVVEALKGSFKVKIPSPNPKAEPPHMFVLARLAGKLRKHSIKIVPGDTVTVAISPYDITKARITYRK